VGSLRAPCVECPPVGRTALEGVSDKDHLAVDPLALGVVRDRGAAPDQQVAGIGVEAEDGDGAKGPKAENYDCIVSAGGDGTFISLIPDAIARNVPMGIVPLGTFKGEYQDEAVTIGLRYSFASPPPPPPPYCA